MLFTPILNSILKQISKKQHKNLIFLIIIFCCIFPVVGRTSMILGNLGWFVALYIMAAYLKKYMTDSIDWKRHFFLAVVLYGVLFVGRIYDFVYINQNSVLVVAISIELFIAFSRMKKFYSKCINVIASTTFGIYLIHDNPLVRPYLWFTLFDVQDAYGKKGFLLFSVIIVGLVFVGCMCIDFFRIATVEKMWGKIITKFILPNRTKVIKIISTVQTDIITGVKIVSCGKIFIKERIWILVPIILSVVLAFLGSKELYASIVADMNNKVEVFYTFMRYSVNLVYLIFPLFILLCHIIKFIFYQILSGGWRKGIVSILVRGVCGGCFIYLIFCIHESNYKKLVQNFLCGSVEEYFFWFIILIGIYLIFNSKTYFEDYINKYQKH